MSLLLALNFLMPIPGIFDLLPKRTRLRVLSSRVPLSLGVLLLFSGLARAQTAAGGDGIRGDEMDGTIGGPVVPDPDAAPPPKQFGPRVTRSFASPTTPASVVISELRLSGPGGASDEFIELANTTSSPIDLTGWTLSAGTVTTPLSPLNLSGKSIPAHGHLLLVNSGGYSLNALAAGDVSYTGDVDPTSSLSLSNASGTVVDLVGNLWAIAAPPSASDQYSYVRRLESGFPADSGNDSDDFNLVDTLATANTTPGAGVGPLTAARLGAPGPQNSQSPIQSNDKIGFAPIGSSVGTPAEGRYASKNSPLDSPSGRLTLRRTITNNTSGTITAMRFRIVAMTGGTTTVAGNADLRALTSAGVTVGGTKVVQGITMDTPSTPTVAPSGFGNNPASAGNGGGLNASWTVDLSATSPLLLTDGTSAAGGIPGGKSINVEFLFAIVQNGSYRVVVDTELVSTPTPVSAPDVTLERLDDTGQSAEVVGEDILNDDTRQTLHSVVTRGQSQQYLVRIKNTGQDATTFRVQMEKSDTATSWQAGSWTVSATPDGQTAAVTQQLLSAGGWTPFVQRGQEVVLKIVLNGATPAPATIAEPSFRIVARSGTLSDSALAQIAVQSLGNLQWSRDGQTWQNVTATTRLTIEQDETVGLRAIKGENATSWPDSQPLGPDWTWGTATLSGDTVWVAGDDVTGSLDKTATATLGALSEVVNIRVVPACDVLLSASHSELLAGSGPQTLTSTQVAVRVTNQDDAPQSATKVRLRALNEAGEPVGKWNGAIAVQQDVTTGADGVAHATYSSGVEAGQVRFEAVVLGENDQPRDTKDNLDIQTHKPYSRMDAGAWQETNGAWTRTVKVSTWFLGHKVGGRTLALSSLVKDFETGQAVAGWGSAAPFDAATGTTDTNGDFSTVQRWNPVDAGAWPLDYQVEATATAN